ncbi:hypothetical protein [Salinicoccus roseus]|uniref:hypothetical protein n=1 Tax=Salinicoccus roseus TaxID=45670 RepID=UPI00230151A2|nr:hypothetical protein [Salinicoccus roseus]
MTNYYTHNNYSIYKQLKQDIRDGHLMLHDKLWVERYKNVVISYTYRREEKEELEIMSVQQLLDFVNVKK